MYPEEIFYKISLHNKEQKIQFVQVNKASLT